MSEVLPETATGTPAATAGCPHCGAAAAPADSFCESCGAALPAGAGSSTPPTSPTPTSPTATSPTAQPRCLACGGEVGADDYCSTCGTRAPSPRDHYVEQPASWVAAACDRGRKHHRNEDATAVAAQAAPGSWAVLVVCDGVSTTADSDVASLAAARRARDVLLAHQPVGGEPLGSRAAALADAVRHAVAQADDAIAEATAVGGENSASCTFAAAVVDGELIVYGNVGDSRVYWLPDDGPSRELSQDDSVAQARIEMGVPRDQAENGPQAHAITKWLGRDSPDTSPRTGSALLDRTGWVLVCSDGLWNYVSAAGDLAALVTELGGADASPLELAEALVRWANAQGGRDNISVALARHTAR